MTTASILLYTALYALGIAVPAYLEGQSRGYARGYRQGRQDVRRYYACRVFRAGSVATVVRILHGGVE